MAEVGRQLDILNDCNELVNDNREKETMQAGVKSDSYGASLVQIQPIVGPSGEGWIQLSECIYMCNLQPFKRGANVYKGKHKLGGEWCDIAVKLLPHTATDAKEIALHWKIDHHPNIIRVIDAGQLQGVIPHIYIAMELCSQTLKEFVDERNEFPVDIRQHFDFAKQIVCGVASIHKRNILHRDIKLENVLLSTTKKNVRITNFGLSMRLKDGYSDIIASTRGLGADGYRAPELLHEKPTSSFRSDSFSLGIVLAMLFSRGHHPFGPDPARWRTNILDNKGRDLSNIVAFKGPFAHKREQLVDLIELCLQRKASRRPIPQEMLQHEFFTDDEVMKQEEKAEPEPPEPEPTPEPSKSEAPEPSTEQKSADLEEPTPNAQSNESNATNHTSEPEISTVEESTASPEFHRAEASSLPVEGNPNTQEGADTTEESTASPEFHKAEASSLPVEGNPNTGTQEGADTTEETQSFVETTNTEATTLSTEPKRCGELEGSYVAESMNAEVGNMSGETKNSDDMEVSQSAAEPVEDGTTDLLTEATKNEYTEGPQPSGNPIRTDETAPSISAKGTGDVEDGNAAEEAGPPTKMKRSNETKDAFEAEEVGPPPKMKRSDGVKEPPSTAGCSRSEVPGSSTEPKSADAEEGPLDHYFKAKKEKIKRLENEMVKSLGDGEFGKYTQILEELKKLQDGDDLDTAIQLAEYELMSKKNDLPIAKLRDHICSLDLWSALNVRNIGKKLREKGRNVQALILFKVSYDMRKYEGSYSADEELSWIDESIIAISSTIDPLVEKGGWRVAFARSYGVNYADAMFRDLRAVNGAGPKVKALREISGLVNITSNTIETREYDRCIKYGEDGVRMMKQQFGENVMHYKDYGGVLINLGVAYDRISQYSKAVDCCTKAIECITKAQDYKDEDERQKDLNSTTHYLKTAKGKAF